MNNLQSMIINIPTARNVAIAIANMANKDSIAYQLIGEETLGWETILQLSQYQDLFCQRESARAIANLAVTVGSLLTPKKNINSILHKWLDEENVFSKDAIVRAEAMRALSSLGSATIETRGPRFAEGIYLLFPQKLEEIARKNYDFDLVFIHGVTGDPIQTWRSMTESGEIVTVMENNIPVEATSIESNPNDVICWPRDWLPKEFPNARIISVGYEIHLSRWLGNALPLGQQSVEICKKLSLAGVGKKPIIWVTHSFGGILTKELLYYASKHEQFQPVLRNTVGVVFFSTPHRGANLAKFAEPLEGILRGTPVVADLRPDSENLFKLNESFPQFASHVSTLSFGENDNTCVGSSYTCFQVIKFHFNFN